jgi:hypothetical protein
MQHAKYATEIPVHRCGIAMDTSVYPRVVTWCRIAPAGTPDTNGGSEDDSGRAGIDRRKRSGQNRENAGRRRTLNDTESSPEVSMRRQNAAVRAFTSDGDSGPLREPSRSAAARQIADRPTLGENYGMPIADVARQVGFRPPRASKILTRGLSS